jgi:multicomponent Na+:H+ antiporter subunit B
MLGPSSFILNPVARFAFFIINIFAVYLLLRGHNFPGGGFIAGLVTAISLVLLSLALGLVELTRMIRMEPVRLAAVGLFLAAGTGVLPLLGGRPYLEQFNYHFYNVPLLGEVHAGTPLLFDIGVYLVVVGATCRIIFSLAKSTQHHGELSARDEQRYSSILERPIEERAEVEMPKTTSMEEEL